MMPHLTRQLNELSTLSKTRDVYTYQFYTSENQMTIIDLIIEQLNDMLKVGKVLPRELYINLMNMEHLAITNIKPLCILYSEVLKWTFDNRESQISKKSK